MAANSSKLTPLYNFVDYIHATYEHTKFHSLPLATHPPWLPSTFHCDAVAFPSNNISAARFSSPPLHTAAPQMCSSLRDTAKVLSLHSRHPYWVRLGAGILFNRAENRQKQTANAEVGVIRFCTDYCQNYGRHSIKRIRVSSAAFSEEHRALFLPIQLSSLASGHFPFECERRLTISMVMVVRFRAEMIGSLRFSGQPFQSTFMASLCTTYTKCFPSGIY